VLFPAAAEYPLAQFETALEHAARPDKPGGGAPDFL